MADSDSRLRETRLKKTARILRTEGSRGIARVLLQRLAARPTVDASAIPDVWTEYLSWLQLANAGMMSRGNVSSFDFALRNLPSGAPMLEIGSFCGLSTNAITYLKEKHGVKNTLVTCDKWVFEGAETGQMLDDSKSVSHADYQAFVKRSFRDNVLAFSATDLPYTIEAFSDEFFDAWSKGELRRDVFGREFKCGGPISFSYIDGNHTYDFARRDFENTDRYLQPGGFVLFDDSADDSGWEVCDVVREVIASRRYEIIARNPNYLLRKLKEAG